MNLPDKLAALEKIFGIYDEFAVSQDVACKKYCAHCCTTGVTLTTVEGGYADINDFVLSVNTLFLQTIEHLDAGGCAGNLLDMLAVMAEAQNRKAYENNRLTCATAGLIANQALKILMIPPEHRSRMEPILNSLRDIRI